MNNDTHGFSTRAIHHGYDPQDAGGSLVPPLHLTSTFAFDTVAEGAARFAGDAPGHVYSRISNPTTDLLERRIASLEGAEAGLAFSSGMGAITSTLWTLLSPGDRLIADKTLYGCTHSFFEHTLKRFGIVIERVDLSDMDALDAALATGPARLIFFETPANPTLRLVDIAAVGERARAHGAMTFVDSTFASPALTQPLALGADLVMHSATKYLGGHGDLVGGLLAGGAETVERIRLEGMKDATGAVMAPFDAMLVLRGLKTLSLRMERHCRSAATLADWLAEHPAVRTVHYPGRPGPQRALAARQMRRPGGMIALELDMDLAGAAAVVDRLSMIQCAVSLGDAETLIQHPASMTHATYSPEERAAHGISDTLMRLSVGLEEVEDIQRDLDQALCGVGATRALPLAAE